MTIETKHSLHDKVWAMIDNKPREVTIEKIELVATCLPAYNDLPPTIRETYTTSFGGPFNARDFYPDKQSLIASL